MSSPTEQAPFCQLNPKCAVDYCSLLEYLKEQATLGGHKTKVQALAPPTFVEGDVGDFWPRGVWYGEIIPNTLIVAEADCLHSELLKRGVGRLTLQMENNGRLVGDMPDVKPFASANE